MDRKIWDGYLTSKFFSLKELHKCWKKTTVAWWVHLSHQLLHCLVQQTLNVIAKLVKECNNP